jgi:hypothetical protein
MVEPATTTPATTTPPAAGGPERDVLLATKMQIPRPQLWARLDQGPGALGRPPRDFADFARDAAGTWDAR